MARESYIIEGEPDLVKGFFEEMKGNYRVSREYDIPLRGEVEGVFVYDINDTAVVFRLPIWDREIANELGDINIFGPTENIRRTKSELEAKTQFILVKLGEKEQVEK